MVVIEFLIKIIDFILVSSSDSAQACAGEVMALFFTH